MKLIRIVATLLGAVFAVLALPSGAAATWYVTSSTLDYAKVGDQSLKLDLHAVHGMPRRGLVVWVHGGAWRAGSRADAPYERFNELGFAVASVDYRLSPVAKFPAQIHDIKGAIRYLRAEAARTKNKDFDADRIIIAGSSAGGHLAALVGVSNGVKELEGEVGGNLDRSSDVQGIVSYYGASNLMTILAQSKPRGLEMRPPALKLLLGGLPDEVPELARLASPVEHVDPKDPPLLLFHGAADPQMPPEQSTELADAYRKAGLQVTLEMIPGAVHGGPEFASTERREVLVKFINEWDVK